MHYYQFNIGEYRRDTGYLTPMQHYIYRNLIDWYFLDEKPIPSDIELVTRKLGLGNDRSTDVQQVFNDFFTLDGNRYIHGRIEADIEVYRRQLSDASRAGKASAAARKANKQAALERALNDRTTNVQPTNNQEPVTTIKDIVPSKLADNCPHEKIIELYHSTLPTMPSVKVWTEKRRKLLQARWREDQKRQDVDYWERFFGYVAKSDFLCGRTEKPFNCDLEWMLNASNFVKIIEGKYHAA